MQREEHRAKEELGEVLAVPRRAEKHLAENARVYCGEQAEERRCQGLFAG